MIPGGVLLVSLVYVGLLSGVAWLGDRRQALREAGEPARVPGRVAAGRRMKAAHRERHPRFVRPA